MRVTESHASEDGHGAATPRSRGEGFQKEARRNGTQKAQFCLFSNVPKHAHIHSASFMDMFASYKATKKSKEIVFTEVRTVAASGGKGSWLRRSEWELGELERAHFPKPCESYIGFPLTPFSGCGVAALSVFLSCMSVKEHVVTTRRLCASTSESLDNTDTWAGKSKFSTLTQG